MLQKILSNFFKPSKKDNSYQASPSYLIVQLNDKIMPIVRGEIYEDPLDDFLRANKIGEITGGGTLQHQSGEIKYCDLEVLLLEERIGKEVIEKIITKLEDFGAPKGSKLIVEKQKEIIDFGLLEGLGLYLDGVNLPDNVYLENDSNEVFEELNKILQIRSEVDRYWQGNTETAFYFYGTSYNNMRIAIEDFVNKHPLCKGARIIQIA